MQEYSCSVLISLCKNNLNLPLGCLLFCSLCCHVHSIAAMRWFFCFWASQFRSPAIKQTSLSQFKGWFLFILLCRQEISLNNIFAGFTHKFYQHATTIWEEMCPTFTFCGKQFWPIGKLTWLDKNIFHWVVETDFKDEFIKYYFLWRPWIVKTVGCFCPLVLSSTCRNRELLIANPHRPLWF